MLDNFTFYRRDQDTRGGGVMIGISNVIPSSLTLVRPVIVLITIEVHLVPELMLLCAYFPPDSSDCVFF